MCLPRELAPCWNQMCSSGRPGKSLGVTVGSRRMSGTVRPAAGRVLDQLHDGNWRKTSRQVVVSNKKAWLFLPCISLATSASEMEDVSAQRVRSLTFIRGPGWYLLPADLHARRAE